MVSGTDGVGTKLKLAFPKQTRHRRSGLGGDERQRHPLVRGAEPIFFFWIISPAARLDVAVATDVVKGIATGCELSGCALIGGETAEMPSMYPEGEYDLAGFAVGWSSAMPLSPGRPLCPVTWCWDWARRVRTRTAIRSSARSSSAAAWICTQQTTSSCTGFACANAHLREALACAHERTTGRDQRHGTHHRRRTNRKHPARVA